MSKCLVLYVDIEFIIGTVVSDNKFIPIKKDKDDLLWLYFYCAPNQNEVFFGKNNKRHFFDKELNYLGSFFEKIIDKQCTFDLRGHKMGYNSLMRESGLTKLLKDKFNNMPPITSQDRDVPTFISFSSNISALAKDSLISCLQNENLKINEAGSVVTLPILSSYYLKIKEGQKFENTKRIVVLEAINSSLNITIIGTDGKIFAPVQTTITKKQLGTDARRHAIIKSVVEKVNKITNFLSTQKEKDDEMLRQEQFADEWILKLDNALPGRPVSIKQVSFAIDPLRKIDITIKKSDIDKDTSLYVREIIQNYEFALSQNSLDQSDIAALVLIGNNFKNELYRKEFSLIINEDRLFVFGTEYITKLISIYPELDFSQFSTAKDNAAAQTQAEKNAKELVDIQKHEIEVQNKLNDEKQNALKAEAAKEKKVKEYINNAVKFEKLKKYDDALNLYSAANDLIKDEKTRVAINRLTAEIAKQEALTEQYKRTIAIADDLRDEQNWEDAKAQYLLAQTYTEDNSYIQSEIKKINKQLRTIREAKDLCVKIDVLLSINRLHDAARLLDDVKSICPNLDEIEELQDKIKHALDDIQIQTNNILLSIEKAKNKKEWDNAIFLLEKIQKIDNEKSDFYQDEIRNIKATIEQDKLDSEIEKFWINFNDYKKTSKYNEALGCLNRLKELTGDNPSVINEEEELKKIIKRTSLPEPRQKATSEDVSVFLGLNNKTSDDVSIFLGLSNEATLDPIKKKEDLADDFLNTGNNINKEKKGDDDFLNPKNNSKIKKNEKISDDDFLEINSRKSSKSVKNNNEEWNF